MTVLITLSRLATLYFQPSFFRRHSSLNKDKLCVLCENKYLEVSARAATHGRRLSPKLKSKIRRVRQPVH